MKTDANREIVRMRACWCEAEIISAEYAACDERRTTGNDIDGDPVPIASLNVLLRPADSQPFGGRDLQYGAGVRNAHTRTSRYRKLLKAAKERYQPPLQFQARDLIGRRMLVRAEPRYDHLYGVHFVVVDVFPV